jgi:hypothetical protein
MISDIRVFKVTSGEIVKEKNTEGLDELVVEISGDIDKSNFGYRVLIVYVDIYLYTNSGLYTIASIHNFSCQMTETDITKFKDEDYLAMANVVQGATNQSYVMFMQKTSQQKIQYQPIPIPILEETYNNLKTGVYSLWN